MLETKLDLILAERAATARRGARDLGSAQHCAPGTEVRARLRHRTRRRAGHPLAQRRRTRGVRRRGRDADRARLTFDTVRAWQFRGYAIGTHVLSTLIRVTFDGSPDLSLPENRDHVDDILNEVLENVVRAERLIHESRRACCSCTRRTTARTGRWSTSRCAWRRRRADRAHLARRRPDQQAPDGGHPPGRRQVGDRRHGASGRTRRHPARSATPRSTPTPPTVRRRLGARPPAPARDRGALGAATRRRAGCGSRSADGGDLRARVVGRQPVLRRGSLRELRRLARAECRCRDREPEGQLGRQDPSDQRLLRRRGYAGSESSELALCRRTFPGSRSTSASFRPTRRSARCRSTSTPTTA